LVEKEIIEACKNGDLHDFRKLVEKTSPRIFSVAFRMLGDEDTASDVVQDTLVTVWQKLHKIKSPDSYKTWVFRITVNKCYDHLRRLKREKEMRLSDQAWSVLSNHISVNEITELDNYENAMIINFLTNNLSPRQKTVFVLSELEDLSYDEIARITGMYRSAVKANLYYARKKIGSLIKKYI
jgi:RNA polymerase sigma-70 factor (ECF subfamily)